MKDSTVTNSNGSPEAAAPRSPAPSLWQRLNGKRISYLTLPLLIMATITEFVILATGWKYQQVVCLPLGMGVTFFGIGPIGATILAVELLKLPLAIWTASRQGWQKGVMLVIGLPMICLLTFQLVKDMAVYEMGIAMTPANQMLKQAIQEDVKMEQLNGELAAIEAKKGTREDKLADLAARKAKAKADLEESLKRNEESRQDAISLTDYQKKQLSEVESRQAVLIKQFDADAESLTQALADLRARRETELGRANQWNAEEARIDNVYKAKMLDYDNKKAAYEKARAEYDGANILARHLMKEPVDPGVPPQRDSNTILKPTAIAELDVQIKAKEAELLAVNNQRRDRVAHVDDSADLVRQEFDRRSAAKREEADHKREELLAAQAALETQWAAEEKQIDQEFDAARQKVDGIRAEIDGARKKAESFYAARETAIENTQVHRIATTVEIVRGLLAGQRPVSIKTTAKERGDLYTDQISMVRIWVYPVLAFIVAFLPTLMVEIGFSTLFHPEQTRPPHRLGFLGRRLHDLYIRAGHVKILRAERIARQASGEIAARERTLAEKEVELQAAREAASVAAARYDEQLQKKEDERAVQLKIQEEEWIGKLAGMADSLNRTVIEKDALRDMQKSEVERQIQMRQNAWSDRLTQMRQELDDQRAAGETERTALMQAQQKKLLEVSEECKTQVIQARRQAANSELAAVEATAKLAHDLKEALQARDIAEAQLQQQADSFSLKVSQAREEAAREIEKVTRQEKLRSDRQQSEFAKTLRQREEDFEHQLKQRDHELSLAFDARLLERESAVEQEARRREAELLRQYQDRAVEVDARWKQEAQQREEAALNRLKQREQQVLAQAEARLVEVQAQAAEESRRRESEFERQVEAQSREADTRLKHELQQKEISFQGKLKQREQELAAKAEVRAAELQNQFAADLRAHEEEWARQADSRVRATETRLALEAQQKDETAQARARAREQELVVQLTAQADARQAAAQSQWESESEKKLRAAVDPLKALLAGAEKERDEARESASDTAHRVKKLEKKLTEASSFLNGWRNGQQVVEVA
jgi:hypothetical protein